MREKVSERPQWACQFEKPSTSPNSLEASTTVILSLSIDYCYNVDFVIILFRDYTFKEVCYLICEESYVLCVIKSGAAMYITIIINCFFSYERNRCYRHT